MVFGLASGLKEIPPPPFVLENSNTRLGAPWLQVVFGGPLTFESDASAAIAAAGAEFFSATAAAVGEEPELAKLRTATGLKGAAFFAPLRAALTGRLHGPELAPLLSCI